MTGTQAQLERPPSSLMTPSRHPGGTDLHKVAIAGALSGERAHDAEAQHVRHELVEETVLLGLVLPGRATGGMRPHHSNPDKLADRTPSLPALGKENVHLPPQSFSHDSGATAGPPPRARTCLEEVMPGSRLTSRSQARPSTSITKSSPKNSKWCGETCPSFPWFEPVPHPHQRSVVIAPSNPRTESTPSLSPGLNLKGPRSASQATGYESGDLGIK
jgi:hypothetical protein